MTKRCTTYDRSLIKAIDSVGVPPLPIPNREVKPNSADGTANVCGRVGHRHFFSRRVSVKHWDSSFLHIHTLLLYPKEAKGPALISQVAQGSCSCHTVSTHPPFACRECLYVPISVARHRAGSLGYYYCYRFFLLISSGVICFM